MGFLVPILLTLLCNAGFLFHLPDYLPFFNSAVNWLSDASLSNPAGTILAVLVTIFVVFFSFITVAVEYRKIPAYTLIRFLRKDRRTLSLLLFFLSISALCVFFMTVESIPIIDIVLLGIFVLSGATVELLYFKWLFEDVLGSEVGIIGIILDQLKEDKLEEIEARFKNRTV